MMDPANPACPVRRQAVPTVRELTRTAEELADPLAEECDSPVKGITHRYPDRVLFLVTDQCAMYCRHCTRRRLAGQMDLALPLEEATADAFAHAHTVLTSQFINEQFALAAGLPPQLMGLGHAYEMDPGMEDAFLYELAQAQLVREIFPEAPVKYMPPTKYMTGDIFRGQVQNALFNVAGIMTGQGIQLLGMLTEAIHTPYLQDRFLSLANARLVFNRTSGRTEWLAPSANTSV